MAVIRDIKSHVAFFLARNDGLFSDSDSWGVAPGWYGAAPLALKAKVFPFAPLPLCASVPLCLEFCLP